MRNKLIVIILFLASVQTSLLAQHYVGLKDAYGITGVYADPNIGAKTIQGAFNPGIVYRYEHKKFFAIQTEFNYITKGYMFNKSNEDEGIILPDTTHKISAIEVPILAQAFYRFGWFRPYVTGGAFLGYITKRKVETSGKTEDYTWDSYDKRMEYGVIGGAGLAFTVSRFEIQAEWRYQFAFSFLRDPHIKGSTQYLNPNQMMISLALFYRLGK